MHPKSIILAFFIPLLFFISSSQAQNLVPDPGFEQGGKGWVLKTAKVDQNIKYRGKSSLRYSNSSPKNYNVMVSHINVKSGDVIEFSAWIKGRDIKAASDYAAKGGGIYVHAYDKDNKSLGGSNPPTVAGSFEWTKVEGRYVVPPGGKRLAVSLYLVKGNTGTIWFDQVEVKRSNSATALASSKVVEKATKRGRVYIDAQGFTVKNGKRIFPFGMYIGKGEKQGIWKNANQHLKRIRSAGFNTVLSYYHGDRADAEQYLDRSRSAGLNVIYNLSDMYDGDPNYTDRKVRPADKIRELVGRLKDKPAMLSWYSADEINASHILAAERNYQLIKQLDPDHPVYQVNNKPDLIAQLNGSADILGTDPYPVDRLKNANLHMVGDWTAKTLDGAARGKGIWQVVQIYNKGAYQKGNVSKFQDPTAEQIRNMLFQSVIRGAKGIMFYAYHDLWHQAGPNGQASISNAAFQRRWADVSAVASEFEKIIPILLEDKVVKVPGTSSDVNTLRKAWSYQGKTYVMEASLKGSEARFYEYGAEPEEAQASLLSVESAGEGVDFTGATDPWRWTLTLFGFQPTPLDRSILALLTA